MTPASADPMSKPVLLYVEDEDAAAFLLETTLNEAGIEVQLFRVSDGEQALAFLGKSGAYQKAPTPDLILLDLNLPRITGLQVLERLRENGTGEIPVTVFTSSRLPSDRRNALALGARQYITKPSDLDGFMEAVRKACWPLVNHGIS
jgi:two-component system, chemotaxis family, response regulator Rcp1